MELNYYQTKALLTAVYPAEYAIIYPALGMNGEAGEVADKVKKIIRDTEVVKDSNGKIILDENQRKNIALEIGDVLWYVATLSYDIGLSLEEVANLNIEKLESRQQRGKLGGSGDHR